MNGILGELVLMFTVGASLCALAAGLGLLRLTGIALRQAKRDSGLGENRPQPK